MPTIKKPNQYFDATVFTGTGATLSVTNAGAFKPDFVWIKDRLSGNHEHMLFDSVRGATNYLRTNTTAAEQTVGTTLTAFNSNGFTVGSGADSNPSGNTAIAWQWQAGSGTTTVNTSGSISSNVSVNTTAGFSIVTYTGSGAAGTVGHGLGVAPSWIITKKRSNAGGGSAATNWVAWHKSLSGAYNSTTGYIYFNDTAAAATTTNFYDGTAITSTTFRWQTGNDNINYSNDTFVSYCWAEVEGYSKFGSYTGNGSTDGPFQYTGFRPKFVVVKQSSAAGEYWNIIDASRSPYNVSNARLSADQSSAESTAAAMDLLSNGFKIRESGSGTNTNGATYIYMAFAEAPFKYSSAR